MTEAGKVKSIKRLAGWLPAVILPLAALDQLVHAIQAEDVSGVSPVAWSLFLVANLGSLTFAPQGDKVAKLQVWLAFGTTSLLEIGILLVLFLSR